MTLTCHFEPTSGEKSAEGLFLNLIILLQPDSHRLTMTT